LMEIKLFSVFTDTQSLIFKNCSALFGLLIKWLPMSQ
jgi:hypothetical protein